MQFNPEDELLGGPRCRNCHKGSSGCGGCHNTTPTGIVDSTTAGSLAAENYNLDPALGAAAGLWRSDITNLFMILLDGSAVDVLPGAYPHDNSGGPAPFAAFTKYQIEKTSTNADNEIYSEMTATAGQYRHGRTADWASWVNKEATASASCLDDGFSWPHRTLGWKMLKDDLFGLDFDGDPVAVGETRTYDPDGAGPTPETTMTAHDIDSVCLDCHNPTVWNASSASDHVDDPTTAADDMDDDVLLRGLP